MSLWPALTYPLEFSVQAQGSNQERPETTSDVSITYSQIEGRQCLLTHANASLMQRDGI